MTAVRDWWEDPDCPPLPDPPKPPLTSDLTCHVFHKGPWTRRVLYLAPGKVAQSSSMALRMQVTAKVAVQDVWLQFQRTTSTGSAQGLPYSFYITHIPAGAIMTIDGIRDRITLTKGGVTVDGSHLVFRSATGHVFRWPEIDCGSRWQVVVRHPTTYAAANILVTAEAAVKYV